MRVIGVPVASVARKVFGAERSSPSTPGISRIATSTTARARPARVRVAERISSSSSSARIRASKPSYPTIRSTRSSLANRSGHRLPERRSARAQQDPPEPAVLLLEPLDALDDRLGSEDHAGSAPEGTVVDRSVAVAGEVPEIDQQDPREALLPGHREDALPDVGFQGLGEQGQDRKERQEGPLLIQKGRAG
jgi:hypothetical protein